MFLSVVIPAYNEEKRIKETLIGVNDYLTRQKYDYEIIVVNDGSTDATVLVIKNLNIPNLHTINNQKNHGKGYVVRQGLLLAKGDYRLFTDADNSTPIEELSNFLPHIKGGYDIIIGSRSVGGAQIINPQPLYRRVLGDFFSTLVMTITELRGIEDTQCGFKLLSAKAVNRILPKCKVNGFAFDPEILIIAKGLGYPIKEVPVTWSNEPQTKVRFWGMAKVVFDLLKIRWNLITRQYK